jgi:hypothetical protein
VSGASSNRVYALVENDNGGLFKSDDAGASWALVNDNRAIRQRAFYYTHVFADPKNADVVYMQNTFDLPLDGWRQDHGQRRQRNPRRLSRSLDRPR